MRASFLFLLATITFSVSGISQNFTTKVYKSLNSKDSKVANVITVIYQEGGLATFSRSETIASKEDAGALVMDVSKDNYTVIRPDESSATFEFVDKSRVWVIPMEHPEKFYNMANKPENSESDLVPMLIIEAQSLRYNSGN